MNVNVDVTTNRVVATGVQYDAAGNMINDGTQAYTFDEANRLKTVGPYSYTYSGLENKRVIVYNSGGAAPAATFNLYSPDGKRMGSYGFSTTNSWATANAGGFQNLLYLGNKALTYTEDRIGSSGNYYPYGNGYNVTGPESQAFGTYVQDESGLLYADQRYYDANLGRFLTADRSNSNVDYRNPTSWNRYAYSNGDPVNGMDNTGQGTGTLTCGSVSLSICSIENVGLAVCCGNSSVVNPPGGVPIFFTMDGNSITVNAPMPFSSGGDPALESAQAIVQQTASYLAPVSVGFFFFLPLGNTFQLGPVTGSASGIVQVDSNSGVEFGTLGELASGNGAYVQENMTNGSSDGFFLYGENVGGGEAGALFSPTSGSFGYYGDIFGFGGGVYGSLGGTAGGTAAGGGGGPASSSNCFRNRSHM